MTSATTQLAMTHLVPLAKELDEKKVTPGVLGFIVFALIGGAVWLLMKSMNKQFTKIDFEEAPAASAAGASAAGGAASAERTADASSGGSKGKPKQD
ncbi:hypothetical protein ACFYYR_27130 [Streptomyces sp. NPDC001922]|uniref:hypothetical protein n=1 Tax=Streptomyces sp. NPDC001922 TaxID=3364624 RepID=UPI00369BF8FB